MLIINVDIFKTVCKLCIEWFADRANSTFQFVRAAKFIPNQLLQNKPHRESVIVNCLYTVLPTSESACVQTVHQSDTESVRMRLRVQTTEHWEQRRRV